jgi:hypothetical protein
MNSDFICVHESGCKGRICVNVYLCIARTPVPVTAPKCSRPVTNAQISL